jgi:regulator of replication initiation timing
MDFEEAKQIIAHSREIIKAHTRNLRVYEQQAAGFGDLYVPPHIKNQIDSLKEQIQTLDTEINNAKVQVVEVLVSEMDKLETEGKNYISLVEIYKQYLQDTEAKRVAVEMIIPDALNKYSISINPGIMYNTLTQSNIFTEMEGYTRGVIRSLEDVVAQVQKRMSEISGMVKDISSF